MECKIIYFSAPIDQNISVKEMEKVNIYVLLICELQLLYRAYTYEVYQWLWELLEQSQSHLKYTWKTSECKGT